VYFTAVTHDELNIARSVILTIDGYSTPLTIESADPLPPLGGVSKAYNFPNPMRGQTDFVFEADAANESGRIRIFSTEGRQVASLDINQSNYRSRNQWCVPWSGVDDQGDELANGTYLYRVEMEAGTGWTNSDMQRLVVMR
jgi:flagellar hook assembly protein FlgD